MASCAIAATYDRPRVNGVVSGYSSSGPGWRLQECFEAGGIIAIVKAVLVLYSDEKYRRAQGLQHEGDRCAVWLGKYC